MASEGSPVVQTTCIQESAVTTDISVNSVALANTSTASIAGLVSALKQIVGLAQELRTLSVLSALRASGGLS